MLKRTTMCFIIFLLASVFYSPKSVFAGGFHLGITNAVRTKVTELDKKIADKGIVSQPQFPASSGIAPNIISILPFGNSKDVSISTAIAVTFDKAMDPASISNETFLLKCGTSMIAGTRYYSGFKAIFVPIQPLSYGTTYSIIITTGARDTEGNNLQIEYHVNFLTKSPKWVYKDFGLFNSNTPFDYAAMLDEQHIWAATSDDDLSQIIFSSNCGRNWLLETPTTSTYIDEVQKMAFVDSKIGWLVTKKYSGNKGDTFLGKTVDGGKTWANYYSNLDASLGNSDNHYLFGMAPINQDICYVVGLENVYKTTNGGLNWADVTPPEYCGIDDMYFEQLTFSDAFHGWAASDRRLFITSDGGVSWTTIQAPWVQPENASDARILYPEAISFLDSNTGFACVTWTSVNDGIYCAYKTTDGGVTWRIIYTSRKQNPQPENEPLEFLTSIYFENTLTGWIGGGDGLIIKTIDGGTTWNVLNHEYAQWSVYKFIPSVTGNPYALMGDSGIFYGYYVYGE